MESKELAVGQVWRSEYSVEYEIIGIWRDWVWTCPRWVHTRQQPMEPAQYRASKFVTHAGMRLVLEAA